ncbi:MAG: ChbG/HpnK family deacetylase [Hyphomicrobiales bacterium]
MLRFVLCADDFALNEGVSGAILDLLRRNRISATSAMTNRENWLAAAPRLRQFGGAVDLGVHLNLTCGSPLGVMSSFAPSGELPALGRVLRWALWGRLPTAEISDEFQRQIDAFARAMGREPDFLDGHQHVHAFPGIREALYAALSALGLARRLYVRDPADRFRAIAARRLCAGKAMVIARLARGFGDALQARAIAANAGFAGIVPFNPRRDYAADFACFLRSPGERHLVMCHPGYVDGGPDARDPVGATRPKEHGFFASDAFPALLRSRDAAPSRFRDLAHPSSG